MKNVKKIVHAERKPASTDLFLKVGTPTILRGTHRMADSLAGTDYKPLSSKIIGEWSQTN
jgi:hypothetical protein